MKIIGIEEKNGVYEGSTFHNVYFHCAKEFDNEKSKGFNVSKVKVKYDILTECSGKELTTSEILSLLNHDVKFHYDEYKNVSFVSVFDSNEASKK